MGIAGIRRGVSAAMLVFTLALFGAPLAGASPTVTGQKYSDASSTLSSAGFKAVVASTVGDRLRWPDCVVSAQRDKGAAQQGNHPSAGKTVEVTLNCDAQPASATTPGLSAGSPNGRAAKAAAAPQG
ncbi:MAG TPA: hypothetical protein VN888_24865 [Mycobacterium sp.]|nr:hypothetical protein [Mycobacterium sp.]